MKSFENKVIVVTGGAHGIGASIVSEFEKEGALVAYIDIRENPCFVGDLSKKEILEAFAKFVIEKYGHVDVLVNNALPLMKGIDECSYEEFSYALAVGFAGRVRVNSISPGWIDTDFKTYEGPDASQQPAGRVGNPLDIANMVLYLASEKAGFITGENICIDGGMTRQMIYHNDCGWSYKG